MKKFIALFLLLAWPAYSQLITRKQLEPLSNYIAAVDAKVRTTAFTNQTSTNLSFSFPEQYFTITGDTAFILTNFANGATIHLVTTNTASGRVGFAPGSGTNTIRWMMGPPTGGTNLISEYFFQQTTTNIIAEFFDRITLASGTLLVSDGTNFTPVAAGSIGQFLAVRGTYPFLGWSNVVSDDSVRFAADVAATNALAGKIASSDGMGTNTTLRRPYIEQAIFANTNYLRAGTGTLSGIKDDKILNVSANGFAGVNPGDMLLLSGSNHQYKVSKVISSSQIVVSAGLYGTYVSDTNAWDIYQAAALVKDVIMPGNVSGAILADGSFAVLAGDPSITSGQYNYFDNIYGTNNWATDLDGPDWVLVNYVVGGATIRVNPKAGYSSLYILDSGIVSTRFGITNLGNYYTAGDILAPYPIATAINNNSNTVNAKLNATNGTAYGLRATYTTGTTNPPIHIINSNGATLLIVNTNGTTKFGGNVGINTEPAAASLALAGAIFVATAGGAYAIWDGDSMYMANENQALRISGSGTALSRVTLFGSTHATPSIVTINSGGAETMRFDASQRVGIGTTTPVSALDVNGSITIRTNVPSSSWTNGLSGIWNSNGVATYMRTSRLAGTNWIDNLLFVAP